MPELEDAGRARAEAQNALDEKTKELKTEVLRALAEGRAEAEVARAAGIDRMTVRKWAGK
jgi:DNA-binding CsgD family transcriptional regulator